MQTFRDLNEIYKLTLKWEKEISDLYDIASYGVKIKESKELIGFLMENQTKHLKVLQSLKLKDYGPIEYVQYAEDSHAGEEIPAHTIRKDTPPREIFELVLKYEGKLRDFYHKIGKALVSESQGELFESLAQFKENQLEMITNYINRNEEVALS